MKNISAPSKNLFLPRFIAVSVFLLIGFFILFPRVHEAEAQPIFNPTPGNSYNKDWKTVDSLSSAGLYKSAEDLAGKILEKARKEKEDGQLVKALMCKFKMASNYKEGSEEAAIYEMEAEVKKAKFPLKQVLQSVLGEMYWTYYNNRRYEINERTQTQNFTNDSIDTWDVTKIVDHAIKNFKASVAPFDSLQKITTDKFAPVIKEGNMKKEIRPSLYDFLVNRAIDFFDGEEPELTQPAEHFVVNKPELFSPAADFVKLNLKTSASDTFSIRFYAMKYYQQLLSFHLNDPIPSALIDADEGRLNIINSYYSGSNKDTLYETAMKKLAYNYSANPYSGNVLYTLAQHYYTIGQEYKPYETDKSRWKIKTAMELCKSTIAKYPGSDGAFNCKILETNILDKSEEISVDRVVIPGKPFPALLKEKNLDSLFLRIAKMPDEEIICNQQDTCLKIYLALPVVKSWSIAIPSDSDYQQHSTQLIIPAVNAGEYMLIISSSRDFSMDVKKNKLAYTAFNSSLISYFKSEKEDGTKEYLFVNRETGEPLKKAKVEMWRYHYQSGSIGEKWAKEKILTTDKNGLLDLDVVDKKEGEFYLKVEWNGNHLKTDEQSYWWYGSGDEEEKSEETFFFTDRAIYRPGQTVFFKGIVIAKENKKSKIVTGEKSTVSLYDVNDQEVKSIELTTNDFGSFSGSFVIPNNGITGGMEIRNETGEYSFSVEEYKRPRFNVSFNQLTDQFRLGDSVKVLGTATTFSGAPLNDATVKFSIQRNQDNYYGWYWRGYYSQDNNSEIANGTITTNDTGGFVFSFRASPDSENPVLEDTRFGFNISVDVTDITGETHSETKYLSIGKQTLTISTDGGTGYYKNDYDSMYLYTRNTDSYNIPTDATLKIFRIQQPSHAFRDRKWDRPDKFIVSKNEWSKNFPEDIYDNENEISTWKRMEKVMEKKVNTGNARPTCLDGMNTWANGTYEYEATAKDINGNQIKTNGFFRVSDLHETKMPFIDPMVSAAPNNIYKLGEKATFEIGSSLLNFNVFYEVEKENKVLSKGWIKLNDETKELKIQLPEKEYGPVNIHFLAGQNNSAYVADQFVDVLQQNEDLNISFETFRDKLTPGEKEEWKLKVKGANGEKVMAEMVAGMYDESLDEFASNYWSFYPFNNNNRSNYWSQFFDGTAVTNAYYSWYYGSSNYIYKQYDRLNWFGYLDRWSGRDYYGDYGKEGRPGYGSVDLNDSTKVVFNEMTDSVGVTLNGANGAATYMWSFGNISEDLETRQIAVSSNVSTYAVTATDANGASNGQVVVLKGAMGGTGKYFNSESGRGGADPEFTEFTPLKDVKARKNLNETVFFYPQLQTDSAGEVIIKFTMGEALTKWKFMALAHTKDLRIGSIEKEVVTQKDLMITPNAPRFLREGDKITFTAKVANLSDKELSGNAQLQLFDAITMKPIDAEFSNTNATLPFTAKIGQSTGLSWDLKIPSGISTIVYKVIASAGNFSDGEENALPVLSNRTLVTETMPINIRGGETKEFHFDRFISQGNGSTTLRNEKLTLEFTSNPAWYAVQALPYMMEYPYECAEQTFSRYYSNSLATDIANSSPKIRGILDVWKNQQPDAFLSSLEKNEDLKNVVLTETPWVMEAKDESERKRRVGLLFDVNHMADETQRTFKKLQDMQAENGGWPWFEGMKVDRYITQYIITGFGHMDHLHIQSVRNNNESMEMIEKGISYLDYSIYEDYNWIMKYDSLHKNLNHLSETAIQYLYARSFFPEIELTTENKKAFDYYFGQAQKFWNTEGTYMKGMLALTLFRYDDKTNADAIMKSIKETALHSDELGMYWKENSGGWYWYQAPIETQSLLIEAFKEVSNDQKSVDDMRVWLLKNKQTNSWSTTKSTADACYALLLDGTEWLATESDVSIVVGSQTIDPKKSDTPEEAGTGYFKTSWSSAEIQPSMGNVKVSKPGPGVSWGSMYWQYFEDLDKITPAKTPLSIVKKLFVQRKTANGIVIEPVTETTVLHPGDKLTVRIELRNDRDMEYIHLKDMRASGFEPVNVFSEYKYQDGLGYYESTKDASTDFFFNYLPKGTHVFEYPLTVIHAGDFSNGITTAECMYAPEFAAHSEGIRVKVVK
jgi:uncharacterized protein YfaS (alpha-2-macroglobulin family)